MGFTQKLSTFLKDYSVFITGCTIIVAVHWGWNQLQHTSLVPKEQRKDLPIVIAAKFAEQKVVDEFVHLTGGVSEDEKKLNP